MLHIGEKFLAAQTNLDLKHLSLVPSAGSHHIVRRAAGLETEFDLTLPPEVLHLVKKNFMQSF